MRRDARLLRALAVAAVIAGPAGCVAIDGGAVEVSWAIFARDGRAINDCSCTDPVIAFVRLQLVSQADGGAAPADPCAGNNACRFTCGRKTGATPFVVPPGQYLMSVVPVGADGNDLPTAVTPGNTVPSVQSPPPESRAVVRGQPTQLEAFMLQADCAARCNTGGIFSPCTAS